MTVARYSQPSRVGKIRDVRRPFLIRTVGVKIPGKKIFCDWMRRFRFGRRAELPLPTRDTLSLSHQVPDPLTTDLPSLFA
ncbi:hypothetical protein DESA109040_01480 [Deinococcus saxicola]